MWKWGPSVRHILCYFLFFSSILLFTASGSHPSASQNFPHPPSSSIPSSILLFTAEKGAQAAGGRSTSSSRSSSGNPSARRLAGLPSPPRACHPNCSRGSLAARRWCSTPSLSPGQRGGLPIVCSPMPSAACFAGAPAAPRFFPEIQEDSGNGEASDQAGDLDASESTEMEVA